MMRVDHLLVGWVRIDAGFHDCFGLVDRLPQRVHQWLQGVAKVDGLLFQVAMRLRLHARFKLLQLIHNLLISGFSRCLKLFAEGAGAFLQILGASWQYASLCHVDHRLRFDGKAGDVILIHDLLPCSCLLRGVDLQCLEQRRVLVGVPCGDGFRRRVQIWQASLGSFLFPLCRVSISRKNHVLVLLKELRHRVAVALAFLHHLRQLPHARGHDGVADHDGQAAVLRGANRTELEAVAAEWERCCSIPVLHIGLDVHCLRASCLLVLLLSFVAQQVCTTDDGIDKLFEALAWIERDNCRRRFLGSEPVVVACSCYAAAHKLIVLRQAICQAGNARNIKLLAFLRLSRIEKVKASISSH
mmetsp:Transcript_56774/g.135462  ORF Transcript_56774/g.135462 Transcript_56774/m.135462 type:complete len:357 (-) Transcript_56774:719-1789(-)